MAADRDRAAFAALFAHFAPRVKAYLMRLGAPPRMAEDLAQEAMLSLWRKAHLFDPAKARRRPGCSPSPATCASTPSGARGVPNSIPRISCPQARAGADDGLAAGRRRGRLRAALKELPADQIQVVELSFFADKPHSQIAAELDIPLGTVKSRLRLAMARLKRVLGEVP